MDFCHITPTAYLDVFAAGRSHHLVLAHLIEEDREYRDWYANLRANTSSTVIMDNSCFEQYKRGLPMYPSEKLIEMGRHVHANYIVMSDYPDEPGQKTIDKAVEMAPNLHEAGFGTFFVPQSKIGDLDDLIEGFRWAASASEVDYIGISILSVPNAYGVERGNNLQRFLSRWHFMQILEDQGILSTIKANNKRIHMLGMVDGPNEILLMKKWIHQGYINTWDSSAAVWAGLNGITFDSSPTGLINGKFEKEVEFHLNDAPREYLSHARGNIAYIDHLVHICETRT